MAASGSQPHRLDGSVTVRVDLLDGGSFTTANIAILHANTPPNSFRMYDWCYHIYHEPSNRHILWDVGISSDRSAYTPMVLDVQWGSANPVGPSKAIEQQLWDLGTNSNEIDTVIFSHAHWDHCRPIREEFPNAKGLFGAGTRAHCSPGHLEGGVATGKSLWDGRFFDGAGFASESWAELNGEWKPFGPFPRALDFFGDGSLMILDAPGHMPGNLAAAVRTRQHDGSLSWIVLASDCCHSRQLLDMKAEFAFFETPGGKMCLHEDVPAAKDTMSCLREAEQEYQMHIAMAHDVEWMREGSDDVLMSIIPEKNVQLYVQAIKSGDAP